MAENLGLQVQADSDVAAAILVVDDDTNICDAVAELLELDGRRVETAHNGREAMAALRRGLRPCCIILDLMMPVMTGWEFLEEVRQADEFRSIPIIIVSAVADRTTLRGDLAGVVTKPFDAATLMNAIDRVC